MSVVAPPPQDELEALIREARARRRKRWLGVAVFVALLSGAAIAAYSIANGRSTGPPRAGRGNAAARSTEKCGIRVAGPRILGSDGSTVYREPIRHEVNPDRIPSQVRCSGPTIWVVWFNGVAASQEGYVGVRSIDSGQTWKLVFAEGFFGVKAPHQLVSGYLGPWTLDGPRHAYFTGTCVACGYGTVSLWVTKDVGRTFRMYKVPALTGYWLVGLRVAGRTVRISARTSVRGVGPPHKTAAMRVS
jgi:hypothetical protein